MAKICTTIQELIDHLQTLPHETAINAEQTSVALRRVVIFSPFGNADRAPELFFETPDEDE